MCTESQQLDTSPIINLCNVTPCTADFSSDRYQKLALDDNQRANLSMLFSQLPALHAAGTLAQAYTIEFPPDVVGTLMKYKKGGFGTPIVDSKGKILAHASLHEITTDAVLLQTFAVMSIATGQYFLTQINNEFKEINRKIDEVLGFLYGEKKAELMSEISFAQFAYRNFKSVMQHDEQRLATITNLQAAKKVAMKDIEFYMNDLSNKVVAATSSSSFAKFEDLAEEAFQIKNTLELSMQLYVMSGVMEPYYAENNDPEFVAAIREDMLYFLNKCETQILTAFTSLNTRLNVFDTAKFGKPNTAPLRERFTAATDELSDGADSKMRKAVTNALDGLTQAKKYCVTNGGDVYLCA
ncbi:MAG: hypothetical protein LUC47_00690 [Clostridiales bacterium]|nr:hypothetical protein [Clostridiales bacterium]